jgi:hypothetical protein
VVEPQTADDLFRVVPSDFTTARNALVKRLKSEGRAEEAARVSKLRRPSPTTWALNQVARQQQELIELVLQSGRQLREATTAALGGDRTGMAEARSNEREAIEAVLEASTQRLEGAGLAAGSEPRRKMAETLRSATVDEGVAALLTRGALDADQTSIGFDFAPILSLRDEAQSSSDEGRQDTPTAAARRHAVARKRLVREVEHLQEKARAAHRAADEAAATAARLSQHAEVADADLSEAQQRLEDLEP